MYAKFLTLVFSGQCKKEANTMSRRGIMSEELKTEIAKELGVYDTVARKVGALLLQGLR